MNVASALKVSYHTDITLADGRQLALYHWYGDGGRRLMRIGVDLNDPQHKIWVAPMGDAVTDPVLWQETKGSTHLDDGVSDVPGSEQFCLVHIMTYVMERIATLMGRCYVHTDLEGDDI